MDLVNRLHYPIVRPDEKRRKGKDTYASGGMSTFAVSEFTRLKYGKYTLKRTGETFTLLDELKKACRFGPSGVLSAFSNATFHTMVTLQIGRIVRIAFKDHLPQVIARDDLVIIGHPIPTGIIGENQGQETVFPHLQYSGPDSVNISASTFSGCPSSFQPEMLVELYLAFSSDDRAVQLLHRSLLEFSQRNSNLAIVLLFAAVETALSQLSDIDEEVKLTAHAHRVIKKLEVNAPVLGNALKKIKKRIEKTIVDTRGDFAHRGQDLTQNDLLPSYETALEFFWHYQQLRARTRSE